MVCCFYTVVYVSQALILLIVFVVVGGPGSLPPTPTLQGRNLLKFIEFY